MTPISTEATEGIQPVITDRAPKDGEALRFNGVLFQAKELTFRTREGIILLSDITFHIEPGELAALTGLSRSGKSILIRSLAGLLKPASGEIFVDGINLYENLKALRLSIGFVPAEFALPPNLTVSEILHDAARLRLPRRTSDRDREQRLLTLLEALALTQWKDYRAGTLSRMEKRKLSIAVELICHPGILLLDESAEPLTPFEEIQITILLRELSRQGVTIIQVDQRSRSAGLSDKVIFLAPGGLLAWFGPPDEAFIYLRDLVPKGIAKDLFGLREALEILANPQLHEGIEWAKRFKANDAYKKYVDDPLHNRYPDLMLETHPLLRLRLRNSSKEKAPPSIIPRASGAQKLMLLIRRNVRLLWRDKTAFFMMAVPPLLGLLDFVLFSSTPLAPDRAPIIFGLRVFLVLLTAALLVQNEIFKERTLYQRENRTSSLPLAYVLSKVWLVGILAIYQGSIWAIIHFAGTRLAGGLPALLPYGITFLLVAFVGGILGLIVSALSRTATTATHWMLLFTIPQLILNGAMIPLVNLNSLFEFLSGINPSRYAVEALLAATGYAVGSNSILFGHWSILAIMSLCLIVLLIRIQHGIGSTRT
jgi:ABC-type multidrug transport system ATPase subunit